ncbi:MAG: hypothetical protein LBD27_02015 [Tannerella sp.]|jgi:cell fate regulator YaaT (PSP1 superfamily)|nr:hypothetical protein [Tannerella sp.]
MEFRDGCNFCRRGYCAHNCKLHTYDWLCNIPEVAQTGGYVEVQFKNTRKGYYVNEDGLPLEKGDIVAVEALPGHDIGMVTLTGKLAFLQMRKNHVRCEEGEIRRIYRVAKPKDLDKYVKAKAREHGTMIHARRMAAELELDMKIGDVEYQGDGSKAIFYYIATERVDFRRLIKALADTFRVRIEMKQIGSRQEAGRIGGIGSCGRELCCASWMTNFVSVATDAVRFQDSSMNPQKLVGQCAKLKCCYNYEADIYAEAHKQMPPRKIPLETVERTYYHFKADLLRKEIIYSTDRENAVNAVTISSERAFEVIELNGKGVKPKSLTPEDSASKAPEQEKHDILDDNLNRFDSVRKRKRKRSGKVAVTRPADGKQSGDVRTQRTRSKRRKSGKKANPANP